MLTIADKTCMASKLRHLLKICIHIAALTKQLVAEQTVHRKDSRAARKITTDIVYCALYNSLIICQLEQNQHIGIIHLAKACKCIALNLLYGNNAGIIAIDFSKRILECLRQNLLVGDMENALVNLLGRFSVQGSDNLILFVCV